MGLTVLPRLEASIRDAAAAGATLIEFYENTNEDPTYFCFSVTDVTAKASSFNGDNSVGCLWAFELHKESFETAAIG